MTQPTYEDHRKHAYALLTRDVRRLKALTERAGLDENTKAGIDEALEKLDGRLWWALLYDPIGNNLIQGPDTYSDGQRVTSSIEWGEGFATLTHPPGAASETGDAENNELSEEMSP